MPKPGPKQRQSKSLNKGKRLTTSNCVYDMTVQKAKTTDLKGPETRDKA